MQRSLFKVQVQVMKIAFLPVIVADRGIERVIMMVAWWYDGTMIYDSRRGRPGFEPCLASGQLEQRSP